MSRGGARAAADRRQARRADRSPSFHTLSPELRQVREIYSSDQGWVARARAFSLWLDRETQTQSEEALPKLYTEIEADYQEADRRFHLIGLLGPGGHPRFAEAWAVVGTKISRGLVTYPQDVPR